MCDDEEHRNWCVREGRWIGGMGQRADEVKVKLLKWVIIKQKPGDGAADPGDDFLGRHTALHGDDDHRQMHDHANGQHGGADALDQPFQSFGTFRRHDQISPFNAALAVARLSPAMEAVGFRCLGQSSKQL